MYKIHVRVFCRIQVVSEEYAYKVKIFNPQKRSKFIVRQLHHFKGKFSSIEHVQEVLCDELDEEVPDEENKYNIMGYFEGRHQTKRWLASKEDLNTMYTRFAPGHEIFLWCDGREEDKEGSQGVATKQKPQSEGPVNKRQAREEELDSTFKELKKNHGDAYSGPQLRLWARMVISGTHDNLDDPPRVPIIVGAPLPKRQKQESIATALVGAATAFAKALSPPPTPSNPTPSAVATTPHTPTASTRMVCPVAVSPGKTADLRMKNLEQLRYMQQLMEDGILSQDEFVEQKCITMDTLRGLHT